MTEEEQLESIKKWWNRYGNGISLILSLILLCIAGYRYMNWHHNKITQQASVAYEHMMLAVSNQDIKSVRSYSNDLVQNYNHTVYADAAHMTLAKIYVSKNKLEEAKKELSFVANEGTMTPLKQIAKIRIARILTAEQDYTKALSTLSKIEDPTFLPVINELKGDIFGATGQYQKAITAYGLALDEVKMNGMANLFLEMKKNELASTHSLISDNDKIQAT